MIYCTILVLPFCQERLQVENQQLINRVAELSTKHVYELKTQYIETQIAYGEKLEMIRRQSLIDKTELQVSLSKMICNKR